MEILAYHKYPETEYSSDYRFPTELDQQTVLRGWMCDSDGDLLLPR